MALKSAFIVRTPDADPQKHRSTIQTQLHTVITVIVKNQSQAIEECKRLVADDGVQLIYLCPAFNNKQVGQIANAVGNKVAITVARGDGPSTRLYSEIIKKEGWIK